MYAWLMPPLRITLGNLTGLGRRLLRDGCTGKTCFNSYAHAEPEIGRLIAKNAHRPELGTLAPYNCHLCGHWHLGHFR